ncbi:MAG: hypothetical protein A3E37_00675 [Candidatus Andersenbacteria bacterium RIFCSPHIGHO2_12_FULL_46_9]|nr:MAG: hypothetical protein UW94_C0003G0049 [Parcubacteria group bacterium GW2011_GWA2_45_14]OGY33793.1 MAG: hypothetical protein A3B76_02940 [Candidatus Andersenbacteria bacterium RIFCSPHIGHO2_02_FULL_46_16]OGY35376.1 MAG: hypothetical protein A3E37_00675 [Candidatus Andersenbacteria bacterium RIFCSPHIGHO2_12_FULL_46_9]OGY36228.1 MAG: hypothetical protein A3I08_05260 [Candidatus Andersenbacteria bacterium RIFCSPLOWO2_02_FULL_46_11]OGY40084.1 MAG: hypothetical protein A3G57_02830 [Candidatus A
MPKQRQLKIVINTHYDSSGTKVCVDDLSPLLKKAGHHLVYNDWDHYSNYQLAIFMSPDAAITKAKSQNFAIKICIMNPMTDYPALQRNARAADALIVGSLEQRDEQLKYNHNIFIYYMFPDIKPLLKRHTPKEPIIIGYHGNKEHLINFSPHVNFALDKLAKHYPVELWLMYNISKLGQVTKRLPHLIKIRHIQWSPDNYHRFLSQSDIGLVNNIIPTPRNYLHLFNQPLTRYFHLNLRPYRAHDTQIRFKYGTNPGRVYVFSQLGIPVISDFAPSMSQVIRDNHSGLIVNSPAGWYDALVKLTTSHQLRQIYSDNLRQNINENFSINHNFRQLNDFLLDLCLNIK